MFSGGYYLGASQHSCKHIRCTSSNIDAVFKTKVLKDSLRPVQFSGCNCESCVNATISVNLHEFLDELTTDNSSENISY